MNEILSSLIRHGALVLFCVVFIEQLGLPLPSPPFLLAAGALVARNQISGVLALAAAMIAALLADSIWYYVGRVRGGRVLKLLCRISLEPDSCVRRTEDLFVRRGMKGIVTAKFLPGLSVVMPPLAGMFRIKFRRFLIFDALGTLLYLGCFLALGFGFSEQLQEIVEAFSRLGYGAGALLISILVAYVSFKFIQRQLSLRRIRMARITPEELRQKLDDGEALFIVDLRSETAAQSDPFLIPGAQRFLVDAVDQWHAQIPRDREVVLYCSCPNEASAARAALILVRRGITRVRPLLGGIDAWREHNFPLTQLQHVETKMEIIKAN